MYEDDELPIPFGADVPVEYIRFRCKRCGFEEGIDADIVDEMCTPENSDKDGNPTALCIKCHGLMIPKK